MQISEPTKQLVAYGTIAGIILAVLVPIIEAILSVFHLSLFILGAIEWILGIALVMALLRKADYNKATYKEGALYGITYSLFYGIVYNIFISNSIPTPAFIIIVGTGIVTGLVAMYIAKKVYD